MNNHNELWSLSLDFLSTKINKTAFKNWFENLTFEDIDENSKTIYLLCNTSMQEDIIMKRYMDEYLIPSVNDAFQDKYNIKLMTKRENEKGAGKSKNKDNYSTTSTVNSTFSQENIVNIRHTFDNFVVGNNNDYAYYTAFSVAEDLGNPRYNPLYIFGDPGLGKTHLMHAICNYIYEVFPEKKVLYVTSEIFANEFISALKNKTMDLFKDKYRNMDILLLDDVQFFKGKETIQEEIFNTFNVLHDSKKQIVLSGDRNPSELEISDRLAQRFGWGLVSTIKKPDFETRVAILENKAEQENININDDVLSVINIIASNITDNVRELESTFFNLTNMAKFRGEPLNTNFVRKNATYLFNNNGEIDVDSIKNVVSQYYGISIKDLEGKKRTRDIAVPRQIAIYITRELTDMSFPSIAEAFGKKDHSTMMHAHKKIGNEILTNESVKFVVDEIMKKIKI